MPFKPLNEFVTIKNYELGDQTYAYFGQVDPATGMPDGLGVALNQFEIAEGIFKDNELFPIWRKTYHDGDQELGIKMKIDDDPEKDRNYQIKLRPT